MLKTKFGLILFSLLASIDALAQSNGYLIFQYGGITFKNNAPRLENTSLQVGGWPASMCDARGNVLLIANYKTVYDSKRNIIENGIIYNSKVPCIYESQLIQVQDTVFLFIQSFESDKENNAVPFCTDDQGVAYTIINRRANGQFYIRESEKKKYIRQFKPETKSNNFTTSRLENGTYAVAISNYDSAFIYYWDGGGFKLKSEFDLSIFSKYRMYQNIDSIRYESRLNTYFNHSGSQLIVYVSERRGIIRKINQNYRLEINIGDCFRFGSLTIDKVTGKMLFPKIIYEKEYLAKSYPNIDKWERIYSIDIEPRQMPSFSVNDNFLYFKNQDISYPLLGFENSSPDDSIRINQLNLSTGMLHSGKYHVAGHSYPILTQSPDGRILINYFGKYDPNNPDRYMISDVIQSPNLEGKAWNYKEADIKLLNPFFKGGYPDQYLGFDMARLNYKIDYDCKANVQFTNNSFSEIQFSDYTWYINKSKGKIDTLEGTTPSVIIEKSGKYPYKVFCHSIAKQYGEWFYDTLFINIPEKPVANFKATDTVICRYLPLQFKNLSQTKETNPAKGTTYVWTFGDGSPSSNDFEPTHTYTKPGTYTASLFYSNGYCDSTLVKNQYIRVVDAPKSGFNVVNQQGCVPFLAEITDTITLNVTKKEYFFSDSSIWKTISIPQFNYTFQKPGHYWAVQKLYGYTGCVIRTDSVQFFVSKGLRPSDSIAIILASYDTLNQLHLQWESHPAATGYNIYRSADGSSFSLLTNTTLTKATDIGVFKKPNYYKVLAADSCGKLSAAKNIIKPQWISGERLPVNEAALLTYTSDEGLGPAQTAELEWTYQHAINLTLGETNPTNPYRDENFANPGYLKKCYRMIALHNGTKMYSNYECIDYEPMVFIPNSFTPNGDGLNDIFLPSLVGIVSYDMRIFSRWGELIYSGNTPWNGTIEGKPAEGEVYMYTIQIIRNDRIREFYRGMVHLLK